MDCSYLQPFLVVCDVKNDAWNAIRNEVSPSKQGDSSIRNGSNLVGWDTSILMPIFLGNRQMLGILPVKSPGLAMLQLWWRWMMPPCSERCKNTGGLGGGSMALTWQINGSCGRGIVKFQVRITYHKDISLRHADLTMVTRWSGIQQSNRKTIQVRGIINCRTMHIIVYRERANIQPGAQFIDVAFEFVYRKSWIYVGWSPISEQTLTHGKMNITIWDWIQLGGTKELKQLGVSHFTVQCSCSQWTNLSLVNSYPIFPGPMDPMFGEPSMVHAHPIIFWVNTSQVPSAVPRAWCVPPAGCAATTALCARGSRGAAGGGRLETQKWWENRWEKLMVFYKLWENPWENLWFDVVYDSWWFPADSQPSHWEKKCFEPWGSFRKSNETIRMTGHFEQEKWGNFAIQTEHFQIFVGLKPS